VKPEKDNADTPAADEREYFAEVQIERQHDPRLDISLEEDLPVGQPMEILVPQMEDVVA
jgi:hypothetical protein